MKKIITRLMFVALLAICVLEPQGAFARKSATQKSQDIKQLNQQITKLVKYPNFTLNDKEDGGEIYVTFMLADDGKITVEKVTAPSKRLEEYVKKELSDKTVNYAVHSDKQRYDVQFRFDNF